MKPSAILALEDGTVFRGFSCGAEGESGGELVFNTAMTGYQEVLTDASYKGQLVVMTYPQIGNYGVTAQDNESRKPFLEGFVVRELCRHPSNWQSVETVEFFLKKHGLQGIEEVDTRALTIRLRQKGALRAVLSTIDLDAKRLVRKARALPAMAGRDLAQAVTCDKPYAWSEKLPAGLSGLEALAPQERPPHVAVLDFGVKLSILRCLASLGCRVTVLPARSSADEVLAVKPDGVVLSNGPGDPEPVTYAIETVRRLLDAGLPLFGICLGHQLLGLALGGRTYKLKFGHHGANHPVKDLTTGKIEITSQNHGFCVDIGSLPREVATTHVNLNDRTSEGLAHSQLPVFSVQYHPEAGAGPHDARYLFRRFGDAMAAARGKTRA
ncbi:MAG: glutamine-hydrolyzing carbamoyl-phosphate synthase small subunit [Elusimicrobia bacterium]|nr:glutamine-hydrolyzing carbamoyl-phosphate synthase small subunit [Elusimicrobiota bacterium]